MATSNSKFDKIRKQMKLYPDSPSKRIILTDLGDIEEQMNAFHFGLSGTLGYQYDSETFEKVVRPV